MGDISEYVTTRQAAEMLGVSKARVDQVCRAGRLKGVLVGGTRLLLRVDVEAFAKAPKLKRGPKGKPAPKKGKGKK